MFPNSQFNRKNPSQSHNLNNNLYKLKPVINLGLDSDSDSDEDDEATIALKAKL